MDSSLELIYQKNGFDVALMINGQRSDIVRGRFDNPLAGFNQMLKMGTTGKTP